MGWSGQLGILFFVLLAPLAIAETEIQCQEKNLQYFEGNCYDCRGNIIKEDGKIICKTCNEGFVFAEGKCIIEPKQEIQKNILDKTLQRFFPENPLLGFILFLIAIYIILRIANNFDLLRKK